MSTAATTAATTAAAARNAWRISWFGEGVEPWQPFPSEVVYDAPHRQLRHYLPTGDTAGSPVLLVPPLAVPASCYDLRPGQSLAAHLVDSGRDTYVIDYGDITFADRRMGFEDWIDDIVPTAVQRVSKQHGGAPVHLVCWSLGGTLALLTAAAHPHLPIASITALGTPIDYGKVHMARPLQVIDSVVGSRLVTAPTALLGGVPSGLVQASFRATAPARELGKPLYLVRNLTNTEALARTEAIDRFMARMPGYPGRLYHQIHTRLMIRRELTTGTVHLSRDRAVDLTQLTNHLLFVGSATDAIGPGAAVEAGVRAFPNAASARYVAADGLSHLGLIAGPAARDTSWPAIDAFLAGVEGGAGAGDDAGEVEAGELTPA